VRRREDSSLEAPPMAAAAAAAAETWRGVLRFGMGGTAGIFDRRDHLRANLMSERTTSENFCQKRPLLSGGTPGQATRGTCRLGQCRQGGAATPIAGMWPANVGPNGR
jgi:hypothetical protein